MSDSIKLFALGFGVVAGIPVLLVVIRAGMFFGALKESVDSIGRAADRFTRSTERRFVAIVEDLAEHETQLQLLHAGIVDERRIHRKLRSLEPFPDPETDS